MREKVSLKITRQIIVAVICGLALIASSSTISVISTNKVDNNGKVGNRWEPTSAVGSTTWATGWTEICGSCMPVKDSYMSGWGGPWSTQFVLRTPGGVSLGDVNLAWDAVRGRFVFAALEIATPPPPQPSVWYGYSTDAHGTSWVVQTKVFSGTFSSAGWDYPSIGADASGHIIMGAVSELNSGCTMPPCANGYYSNISTDGIHFNASPSLVTSGVGTGAGAQSRVIATTTSLFHAFVPTLNNNNLPTKSSDGSLQTAQAGATHKPS